MGGVGGGAVGADAPAAVEAEDVLLVLPLAAVRPTAHEECLLHQPLQPPRNHRCRLTTHLNITHHTNPNFQFGSIGLILELVSAAAVRNLKYICKKEIDN